MSDPVSYLGMKAGTIAAMTTGSFVAGMLMQGQPLHVRIIAGACGCAAAFVFTPLLTPIAFKAWVMIYASMGIPATELSREQVSGFVGFASGLTGIDLCRFVIDKTKSGLKMIKLPWQKKGSRGD